MSLIVQKFGGSSVADIERIQNVARIVANTRAEGHQVVVVVSAMHGETDRLIKLAEGFSSSSVREYDALLATGEQVSSALLSMALVTIGESAQSMTGSQIRILTNDTHKKARIIDVETDILRELLAAGKIPVVAGFQGVSLNGDITTLGRGGSDLTAVALAAALEADECQIFTDVDGVYTSDPRIVPDARRIQRISFEEVMEMAGLGAKVLQNRCLEFAGKYQVPVRVLSSLTRGEGGTLISYQKPDRERVLISGVAMDRKQAQISLQGIRQRPGLLSYILSPISLANIDVDMIVQSGLNTAACVDISFTIHRDDFQETLTIMHEITPELEFDRLVTQEQVAKLSLVGVGLRSHAGVASKMLSSLGREGIEVLLLSASEIKISAMVPESQLDLGARILHDAFELNFSHSQINSLA
jgi:aspartate kinase